MLWDWGCRGFNIMCILASLADMLEPCQCTGVGALSLQPAIVVGPEVVLTCNVQCCCSAPDHVQ
jgi:hypothetical protein